MKRPKRREILGDYNIYINMKGPSLTLYNRQLQRVSAHSNAGEIEYTLNAIKNALRSRTILSVCWLFLDWLQCVDWKMTTSDRRDVCAHQLALWFADWHRFPKLLVDRGSDQMSQLKPPLVSLDHVLNPNHDTDHVLSAVFSSSQGDQFCIDCAAER